ncbi:hypothetical protein H181DRAFT_05160 [Streptomyces sp. WMMB 714]|uniref:hypothetical protein n=1 Tax=Streptomyces sp. WMMB 714 TaxID=1286822 RepID=UPI0005F803B9|nr:hypothetical protein [Streptomyces sp. WMMB 714]SCK55752.1 hypothetical protein H181DRAFT_05160 [Streptomyces sp. WMMB 714]
MQRRARTYLTGVALAVMLSGGLTACTGSPEDEGGEDTKAGSSGAPDSSAPPGRYRTLPEPCGAVDLSTLKKLLPDAEGAPQGSSTPGKGTASGDEESPYEGQPIATYDTDRRAGCRWKSTNSLATRNLTVDFERVVSYDPAVSDDEQAQLLYDERAGQAEIPTESEPPADEEGGEGGDPADEGGKSGSGGSGEDGGSEAADSGTDGKGGGEGGGDPGGEGEKSDSGGGSDASEEPGGEPSPSSDADLSPRTLDDIGDNAYIDDQLDTGDSGVHRDITLVFRSANVIATVTYDQWLTDKRRTPDSAELQEKARSVAEELAADFDDN